MKKNILLQILETTNRSLSTRIVYPKGFGSTRRSLLLTLMFFLYFSNSFSQTPFNLPNEKRCTSKDLELVEATLLGSNSCIECTEGQPLTRKLQLSINNTTGSNRTAFAFWGILHRLDEAGNEVSGSPVPITGCNSTPLQGNTSALPPNTITTLEFNEINYKCGERLLITNLFLAWTSATDNAVCDLDPSKIAPKCGTRPSIEINAGVNGAVSSTSATCTEGGTIRVAPFGGRPPYKVQLDGGEEFPLEPGQSKTFSDVSAGEHEVTITDSTPCSVTKTETVGGPDELPKPEAEITHPTCTTPTGTVNVKSPTAGDTYLLKQGGEIKYTANTSGVFSSVAPGTYDFSASLGECTTAGDPVTVNQQPQTPAAPELKITQPTASLCAATTTGSIEICNPIIDASYNLFLGSAVTPNRTATGAAGLSFGSLAANSNPRITVTVGSCTSAPASCANAVTTCSAPPPAGKIAAPTSIKEEAKSSSEKASFAVFPVPFKDQLTVRYNFDKASQVLIEVFNSQGKKILSKKDTSGSLNKEIQLNLNSKTGQNEVYFVKVTTDKGSSVQKVISSR